MLRAYNTMEEQQLFTTFLAEWGEQYTQLKETLAKIRLKPEIQLLSKIWTTLLRKLVRYRSYYKTTLQY